MKKKSSKKVKLDNEYSKLRKLFFQEQTNKFCKARLPGCNINATDIHHKEGRLGVNYLDEDTWIPVCRSCHAYIHDKLSSEEREILDL